MSEKTNNLVTLRNTAEDHLALKPEPKPEQPPAEELLHELRVYMVELEMQNESLRQSQLALEACRERYFNLFEFAPVSYITLAQTGHITEINHTGATLLGEDRKKLLQVRFAQYIVPEDADKWQRYFVQSLKHGEKKL